MSCPSAQRVGITVADTVPVELRSILVQLREGRPAPHGTLGLKVVLAVKTKPGEVRRVATRRQGKPCVAQETWPWLEITSNGGDGEKCVEKWKRSRFALSPSNQ